MRLQSRCQPEAPLKLGGSLSRWLQADGVDKEASVPCHTASLVVTLDVLGTVADVSPELG